MTTIIKFMTHVAYMEFGLVGYDDLNVCSALHRHQLRSLSLRDQLD